MTTQRETDGVSRPVPTHNLFTSKPLTFSHTSEKRIKNEPLLLKRWIFQDKSSIWKGKWYQARAYTMKKGSGCCTFSLSTGSKCSSGHSFYLLPINSLLLTADYQWAFFKFRKTENSMNIGTKAKNIGQVLGSASSSNGEIIHEG